MKRNHLLPLFALILLITACRPQIKAQPTPTVVETPTQIFIITATLPPTVTPFPTQTPIPPTVTPIFTGITGQTTTLVNVRDIPSAAGFQIGEVQIFEKVQIIGKDSTNQWWMIDFPASTSGYGWVSMEYVLVTEDTSRIPLMDAPVEAGQPAPTTEAGESASDPTPVPTLNLATAPDDGDSFENPAVDKILSETTETYIEYRSELSAPQGDTDDWVEFVFDGAFGSEKHVDVILNCSGSGKINVALLQNGAKLQTWAGLTCDRPTQLLLTLYTGAPYSIHLYMDSETNLKYIEYALSVQLEK